MSDTNENAPGAGKLTGGGGEEQRNHSVISDILPENAPDADQKDLLLKGNTSDAVQFLQSWCPEGPWTLTAIVPDVGRIHTKTFPPGEQAEMVEWIDEKQGAWNIYFVVNPLIRPLNIKPKKIDMRGMVCLHVDVDPRPGEEFEDERVRAEKVLREFVPHPTVIIDSGGGFQGFWLLDEEQRTDGSEERAIELEAYNLQIEVLLHGDSCHNIDRIMRLPGTVNLPNKKKRDKGRVKAPTRVVDVD